MKKHPAAPHRTPVLHPYARISDPEQRKGGGLERQTTANMSEFAQRFGFILSKRVLVDDGVSAFRGLNATPEHQLGQFLAEAKKGLIPPGDCLLLENYDRLSRQDPWAAIGLVNDLRQLGIHVGRLDRMKLLRCDSTDYGDFFEAAIEFMRGNSESAMKSFRNKDRWQKKRHAARTNGGILTHRLPDWIEERDGKLHLLPGPTAALRLIYHLAANGYGHHAILKKLVADGVKPFGKRTGVWARSYITKLLTDRRVLGELQPRRIDKTPEGEPIKNYYPAAITEDEFHAACAGAAQRKVHRGPIGDHVALFSGLLRDALGGGTYYCTTNYSSSYGKDGKRWSYRVLKNTDSMLRGAKCITFSQVTFEVAVLSRLRELDPHTVLNGDQGPDRSIVLAGELAGVEHELADASAFMEAHGFSATIGKRITGLETRKNDLAEQLAQARQEAAHPLSESWGETHAIIDALARAPDPRNARLRLRSALQRIVSSIWLVIVPRGRDRLCAAQVWFAPEEKRCRNFLVLNRPPKNNGIKRTEGGWWCRSFADTALPGDLDLRKRGDVAQLAKALLGIDLAGLEP
jgi:hypothetical protein